MNKDAKDCIDFVIKQLHNNHDLNNDDIAKQILTVLVETCSKTNTRAEVLEYIVANSFAKHTEYYQKLMICK